MQEDAVRRGEPWDVAIVGGGPAGATAGTLLRKYNPDLRVLILERERFPREHVGESQLPAISAVLHEMGVWDKVEAAGFPVKIGASLTWGRDNESWDFDFIPVEQFRDEPRPGRYQGQRQLTAFQVDRAVYDEILLRHAEEAGVHVREGTGVRKVLTDGDRVEGLELEGGEVVSARHYIDASGSVGLFRRALGIGDDAPEQLRNIAIWDYWDNAKWAVEIGVGGTRVQVRSLPYGWIWFIPLSPTRASVGLIYPASYYKDRGAAPEELYREALQSHEQVRDLLAEAAAEGNVRTTKDWSHVADRVAGANWLACGEAAGFADPILAAGMTLAHGSAREAAFTILELDRGELDGAWLRSTYDEKTRRNIQQHIRFAQFWYAANGCFTDLQGHCQKIASEAGLRMSPAEAWRWLAQGGFTNQTVHSAQFGSFDLGAAKRLVDKFGGKDEPYRFERFNVFKLNLVGAKRAFLPDYREGRVRRVPCYQRAGRTLPETGTYEHLMRALKLTSDGMTLLGTLQRSIAAQVPPALQGHALSDHIHVLEAMLAEGWVNGRLDKRRPPLPRTIPGGRSIRSSTEGLEALRERDERERAGVGG